MNELTCRCISHNIAKSIELNNACYYAEWYYEYLTVVGGVNFKKSQLFFTKFLHEFHLRCRLSW